MTARKLPLSDFPWESGFQILQLDEVLTPALILYPESLCANIDRTVALLDGDASRWRVHIKTAKLEYTLHRLIERGVRYFKCATTLELLIACRAGAHDVLVAYPVVGANARRILAIADEFPEVAISVLAENPAQIEQWQRTRVGIFLDLNSGMNRTGIEPVQNTQILEGLRAIRENGLLFRGLHYYDGHYGALDEAMRVEAAHRGYDTLLNTVAQIERGGTHVPEVITAGTPTFPASLSYAGFRDASFIHRVSPGTLVYNDASSLAQLPPSLGYRPAALVVSRVVSHPRAGVITCDAGHKTVSADAGVPTCVVLGHSGLEPLAPSEEHLPISVQSGAPVPEIGELLYLLPRHICPTVNNFDCALVVNRGEIQSVEPVSARGREAPLHRAHVVNC